MGREDARAKGMRYLTSGRLVVTLVSGMEVSAVCRGDSGTVYALGYKRGGWWCDCPAFTKCAHLTALQLVTVRPEGARNADR
jgi:uncharacterized Zn finger protein